MEYPAGSVKYHAGEKIIAIRTIFPEDTIMGNQAWLAATTNRGASFLKTSDVEAEGWADITLPLPPETQTPE